MNDLQIIVNQKQGIISTNFEEIKKELSTQMEVYKELEVTEENKPERKKDIATLRKMAKAVNDKKIEVKNKFMEPYTAFEGNVKELISIIDEPIELIDKQVKVFEEKQLADKKLKIHDTYNEIIGEMGDYLPLKQIYNSKWENVSTSLKSIREEMEEAISSTEMAVNTINGMNSEAVPKALEQYKKDLSLANAIGHINRYEQQKAEILAKEEQKRKEEEERKRRAEEDRIREQERKRVAEEERIREEARRKAIEDERQKVAEAERLKEDERKEEEDKLRKIELANAPKPSVDKASEELFEEEPFTYEPFVAKEDETFTEEPFEVPEEAPFDVAGNEIRTTFIIDGTLDELDQVSMFLDSIGLVWERKDD